MIRSASRTLVAAAHRGRGARVERVQRCDDASPARERTPGAPPSVDAIAGNVQPSGRPVIVLGLDAADWSLLDDYIGRGVMPNLGRLAAEGTSGHLKTLSPALSPLIWTTMMTGTSPLEHGILDFVQFDPADGTEGTDHEQRAPDAGDLEHGDGGRQDDPRCSVSGRRFPPRRSTAWSCPIGCSRFSTRNRRRPAASCSQPIAKRGRATAWRAPSAT